MFPLGFAVWKLLRGLQLKISVDRTGTSMKLFASCMQLPTEASICGSRVKDVHAPYISPVYITYPKTHQHPVLFIKALMLSLDVVALQ